MTDLELTNLSTALVVIATIALFIVLAEWSSGTSWGLTAAIVHGVRGWADDHLPAAAVVESPFAEILAPLIVPRRPIGGVAARRLPPAEELNRDRDVVDRVELAELVDLGERPIDRAGEGIRKP